MSFNALSRSVGTSFFYWLVGILVGLFLFVRVDVSTFQNTSGGVVSKVVNACGFKGLKLGIDLRGGTRLVLRLELDKAIASKMASTGKAMDKHLRKNQNTKPSSKSLNSKEIIFVFSSAEKTQEAVAELKQLFPEFDFSTENEKLIISLSTSSVAKLRASAIDRAVEILRNRMDTMDVKGLTVNKLGEQKVVVQLPGLEDAGDIKQLIMRSAKLEFRLVAHSAYSKASLLEKFDGIVPADKVLMQSSKSKGSGDGEWFLVSQFPDIEGTSLVHAALGNTDFGQPVVKFKLNSEGAREMREVTRTNLGKRLAIIMDERVISAPSINSQIEAEGQITGPDQKECVRLSQLLRSGSMDAPLTIEQECRVGASLGKDSIEQGLNACALALLLLFIFSVFYYRFAGLLAFVALLVNLLVILIMLSFFKATLTLPGIAGMVLTVGMAIDSSILIYEKIREELRRNSGYHKAVQEGFDGAMTVILDSNITTFIAGIALFWFGGPAVRGFAVTLMLGVISTIITGVYFLRSSFNFCLNFLRWHKISL